jgi:hypothetical protein
MPYDLVYKQMKTFAEKVMPRLKAQGRVEPQELATDAV